MGTICGTVCLLCYIQLYVVQSAFCVTSSYLWYSLPSVLHPTICGTVCLLCYTQLSVVQFTFCVTSNYLWYSPPSVLNPTICGTVCYLWYTYGGGQGNNRHDLGSDPEHEHYCYHHRNQGVNRNW